MAGKIPPDAFDFYFSLGPARSYQSVARKYGVSKRAVTKHAAKADWQGRLLDLERKAREVSNKNAIESLDEMAARHLKILKAVQGKALGALQSLTLGSAMDAIRALDMTIKQERLVRGEPSDRTVMSIEEKIRTEYDRWMTIQGDNSDEAETG